MAKTIAIAAATEPFYGMRRNDDGGDD
jgi:hypothetical protein